MFDLFTTNKLDGIDCIYWINLDRCRERKKSMEEMFSNPVFKNIKTHRVCGIDGTKDNISEMLFFPKHAKYKDSEYGCILSHLECIRRFSETDDPIALVAEDDITLDFQKYWRKSIRQIIQQAPNDWEIIQLCYIIKNNEMQFEEYSSHYQYSTAAYLIKNGAAKQLIADIYENGKWKLDQNIHHVADEFIYKKCKTYNYKYPVFMYKTENDSLIHPTHIRFHNESKLRIEQMCIDCIFYDRLIQILLLLGLVCVIILSYIISIAREHSISQHLYSEYFHRFIF
jgi:GR25 family glycosyltransferase involved in LPS biosynthesis